ncbi:OLC1v1003177C1 [Oldenlandia corymbosa var. corymbosa]|uniref:OLC1v1003177C1 n=1 Tax=Oldenlandia corymbosa var. corymbosa TaxID=529605 RepID=A0AAV1D9L9_OLDCO|nr:OLC1v1003177C1 [Oldenlandia corymbosa var. corymbosa]
MSSSGLHRCRLFLMAVLIIVQGVCICKARQIPERHKNGSQQNHEDQIQMDSSSSTSSYHHVDLAAHVFFLDKDLKFGNRIPVYFTIKDPSRRPPLLPREEADSIPFSSSKLPHLIDLLSISQHSPQAEAMKSTLSHCEFEPLKTETKFCATSLESMLDSARDLFGSGTPFEILTTNHLANKTSSILQNYTIVEEPKVIVAPKMLACHTLPYPYAVFYCHCQKSDNNLYRLMLVGDDGDRTDAIAICHMDTSEWDPNHVAFKVLKTVPGQSPVCHFFPADNLVWVASAALHNE